LRLPDALAALAVDFRRGSERGGSPRHLDLRNGLVILCVSFAGCAERNKGPAQDSSMDTERLDLGAALEDSRPESGARALADARKDATSCSADNWCVVATVSPICPYKLWGSGPSDVFAAGAGSVVYHYDGSTWSTMTAMLGDNLFWDIWGSGPTDVYVVGQDYFSAPGCSRYPRATHYDGVNWQEITSFTCSCTKGDGGYFHSVWGSSASDVYTSGVCDYTPLWHFDGTSWKPESYPFSSLGFNGIWGSGPSDVWGVIVGYVAHYDGISWTTQGKLKWSVDALWGSSSSDIYAVGVYPITVGYSYDDAIAHYDGTAWSAAYLGTKGSGGLSGVWGSGASDVYAVGSHSEILHYDGKGWSAQVYGVTDLDLKDIWGSGPDDVYAVGCISSSTPTGVILHRAK
jgi:hypothetical protein